MSRALSSVVLVLVVSISLFAQDARQASVTLKAAQAAELVERDLRKAIGLYERAVKEARSDRALVAQILLQLAEAQMRAGRTADARTTYERVVREHADSGTVATTARERLREQPAIGSGGSSSARLASSVSTAAPRPVEIGGSVWVTGHQLVAGGTALLMSNSATAALQLHDLSTGKATDIAIAGDQQSGPAASSASRLPRSPVLSPDSSMVAYLVSSAAGRPQLKLQSIRGPARMRVLVEGLEVFPVAWSSQRNALLAKRSDRTGSTGDPLSRWSLVWVSLTDGSMTTIAQLGWRITGAMRPALSPDEQFIAYAATEAEPETRPTKPRAGNTQVYVVGADGSGPVQLTQSAGSNRYPVWTPDGKWILFTSDRSGDEGLWSMAVERGRPVSNPVLLWTGIAAADLIGISRTGTLYYRRDRLAPPSMLVAGANADGRTPIAVTGLLPAWSPDGRALAFLRPVTSQDGSPFSLVVRNQGTGSEQRFNRVPLIMAPPRWLHDGRRLLVATRPGAFASGGGPPESERQYLIVDITTGIATDVLRPDALRGPIIGISPDDASLFLLKRTSANAPFDRVVAHDIASGHQRETLTLTGHSSGAVRHVTLSPDGAAIAIVFADRAGGPDRLGVAPAATGVFQELALAEPGSSRELQWSGTGRYIYWTLKIEAEDEIRVMRVEATGGALEFTGLRGRHVVSPDGRSTVLGGEWALAREFWSLDVAALIARGR